MPRELRGHGCLLEKTGSSESLLRYMLLNRSVAGVFEKDLRAILLHIGASIVKMGEKNIGRKSLLWSLIVAVLSDLSEDSKLEILTALTGHSAEELVPDAITDAALNSMSHEEVHGQFGPLRERLDRKFAQRQVHEELTRQVGEKAAVVHHTPQCIKDLKPPWRGCTLTMDFGLQAFEAYYPQGNPTKSVSMKWALAKDSSDTTRSQLSALTYCVEYLWKNQAEKGRVPRLRFHQMRAKSTKHAPDFVIDL